MRCRSHCHLGSSTATSGVNGTATSLRLSAMRWIPAPDSVLTSSSYTASSVLNSTASFLPFATAFASTTYPRCMTKMQRPLSSGRLHPVPTAIPGWGTTTDIVPSAYPESMWTGRHTSPLRSPVTTKAASVPWQMECTVAPVRRRIQTWRACRMRQGVTSSRDRGWQPWSFCVRWQCVRASVNTTWSTASFRMRSSRVLQTTMVAASLSRPKVFFGQNTVGGWGEGCQPWAQATAYLTSKGVRITFTRSLPLRAPDRRFMYESSSLVKKASGAFPFRNLFHTASQWP
mmetsp:Transcript_12073/g.38281  ORF Transcript_12073/g.38281 Transcript_12073/m.38281 type:complete len:287 (+) Transcript_12073:350-1210(+)